MKERASQLNQHIAQRVRELRVTHGLSLDALARKSGVSRSMLSLIERGESSPTAVILEKLASGLYVTLASLFETAAGKDNPDQGPVARRGNQPEWRDPGSGYTRRIVSPRAGRQRMQIVEVHFPPGARVAFDATPQEVRAPQQIWILEGSMQITVGKDHHILHEGDCLSMQLGSPTMFHNPSRKPARYAVVIATDTSSRR